MKVGALLLGVVGLMWVKGAALAASGDLSAGVSLGSGFHTGIATEAVTPLSFDVGAFGRYGLSESLSTEVAAMFFAQSGYPTLSLEAALVYRWDVLRWIPQADLGAGYQLALGDAGESGAAIVRLGGGVDYLFSRRLWLGARYHLLIEFGERIIGPSHRLSLRLEHAF